MNNTAEKLQESIFDHNYTDDEWVALFGNVPRKDMEQIDFDEECMAIELYKLYSYRGDKKTATQYLNLIDNELTRFNIALNDHITS